MMGSKKRRSWALALGAAAIGGVLATAAPAGAAGSYTDPSGDNGAAAGDITSVGVTSDASSGQVIIRVSGSHLSETSDQLTFVNIDSDANPTTGDFMSGGADYWFGVDDSSYYFEHWNGIRWETAPDSTVTVVGGGGTLLFSVNKRELGNTSDFNLSVETHHWTGSDVQPGDTAPNDGMYNYSLDAGGPLIQSVDVQTTPSAGPKAGKRFVVTPTALKLPPDGRSSSTPIIPESYSCKATLKGKPLAGTGIGGCTFAVPKKARGKTLNVVLTVNYEGVAKPVSLSFRVR
jgi:hypothetical protein